MTTRNHAIVLSTHRTSEGTIRYVRRPDGSMEVQLQPAGAPVRVVGSTSPTRRGIAPTQAETDPDATQGTPGEDVADRDLARCA